MKNCGRLELIKIAAARVINTLSVGDDVKVVSFDSSAEYVYQQGNLIQATDENKTRLKAAIAYLSARLGAFAKSI